MADFVQTLFQHRNRNMSLIGENIVGNVTNNSNVKLHCQSSTLNVTNSTNCKISVTNSEVTANSCSNSDVSGTENILIMTDNSNTSFNGDHNTAEISSNTNSGFRGNNGRLKILDNSNTKINGNGNRIEAKGNRNLKIAGDKNQLTISDTINHLVKISDATFPNDRSTSNQIEVIPTDRDGSSRTRGPSLLDRFFGFGSRNNYRDANIRFGVTYLKTAKILNNRYDLGIFKFKVEDGNEPSVLNLHLDAAELDQDSLNITCTGNDRCIVIASKDGEKQRLEIIGPLVKHRQDVDPKLFTINYQTRSSY